jgi:hypothetical protein
MTKTTKLIHNVETGEITEIELTADELAEAALQDEAANARIEAETAKAAAKATLLAKLGITADEAALLFS